MKVGFVGLGIMGRPMAHNLMKGGHQLFVYGKRTVPPEIREGATVCDTLKAVAEQADVVIIMVPDTPDVQNVLFSPDGVAAGLKPGKTVVDMSSISPIETKVFAAEIVQKGCDYVDAPVSGGEVGAKAASLTIMVGGEALLFASKAGADPAKVRQALMGGFAASRILEVHGERMIKRTFDPGFRIELHQKDLSLALSGARALNLSLPNTATTQELFNAAAALGGKGWDHSGLVRVLEHLAGHQVAKG
jgi:2-hydroxy-3-oxopropionate reductase